MKNKLQRRQEGIKRARRVLKAQRAYSHYMISLYPETKMFYANGGEWEKTLRKTRKPCSCYMCGHRREMDGPTIKEKISKEEMLYEIKNETID